MSAPDTGPPPRRHVEVREFQLNFPDFMRQVGEGASFAVTSRGTVVALVEPPLPPPRPPRRPGTMRGQIAMTTDFDELPDDVLRAMHGLEG